MSDASARPTWPIALAVAMFAALAFLPSVQNDFLLGDDALLVTENPNVNTGLAWENVRWAFTSGHAANWNPLTRLARMLDVQLFGLNPAGHHAVNLLLHAINSALVFVLARRWSDRTLASALIALAFAVHPVHVESVAWVSSRKDVLSGFFWLLGLYSYGTYVAQRSFSRYLAVAFLFACAFMAKPVAVTFPVTLLLLDLWPLGRCPIAWSGDAVRRGSRLVVEKLPLFVLAAVFSGITIWVQRQGGAMDPLDSLSLPARVNNALTSYGLYLWHTVYPFELIFPYPHPGETRPLWHGAIAAIVLIAISVGAWTARRRAPHLMVGWLWFLVTLLPTIGLIQVGFQGMADRYMYMPLLGLLFTVFSVSDGASRPVVVTAAIAGLVLVSLTVRQQLFWRTSETLLQRAVHVAPRNVPARIQLGYSYLLREQPEEAERQLRIAIDADPASVQGHSNLGSALRMQGRLDEAAAAFRRALDLDPDSYAPLLNLATLERDRGNIREAAAYLERAVALRPADITANRLLVMCYVRLDRIDLAEAQARRFVETYPDSSEMRAILAELEGLR